MSRHSFKRSLDWTPLEDSPPIHRSTGLGHNKNNAVTGLEISFDAELVASTSHNFEKEDDLDSKLASELLVLTDFETGKAVAKIKSAAPPIAWSKNSTKTEDEDEEAERRQQLHRVNFAKGYKEKKKKGITNSNPLFNLIAATRKLSMKEKEKHRDHGSQIVIYGCHDEYSGKKPLVTLETEKNLGNPTQFCFSPFPDEEIALLEEEQEEQKAEEEKEQEDETTKQEQKEGEQKKNNNNKNKNQKSNNNKKKSGGGGGGEKELLNKLKKIRIACVYRQEIIIRHLDAREKPENFLRIQIPESGRPALIYSCCDWASRDQNLIAIAKLTCNKHPQAKWSYDKIEAAARKVELRSTIDGALLHVFQLSQRNYIHNIFLSPSTHIVSQEGEEEEEEERKQKEEKEKKEKEEQEKKEKEEAEKQDQNSKSNKKKQKQQQQQNKKKEEEEEQEPEEKIRKCEIVGNLGLIISPSQDRSCSWGFGGYLQLFDLETSKQMKTPKEQVCSSVPCRITAFLRDRPGGESGTDGMVVAAKASPDEHIVRFCAIQSQVPVVDLVAYPKDTTERERILIALPPAGSRRKFGLCATCYDGIDRLSQSIEVKCFDVRDLFTERFFSPRRNLFLCRYRSVGKIVQALELWQVMKLVSMFMKIKISQEPYGVLLQ